MSLFQLQKLILHSGEYSNCKIECDFLTKSDWQMLAYLVSQKFSFKEVQHVITGGLKLAQELHPYIKSDGIIDILIVDDVLTTGNSMESAKMGYYNVYHKTHVGYPNQKIVGVVAFARKKPAKWIYPIFQLWKGS